MWIRRALAIVLVVTSPMCLPAPRLVEPSPEPGDERFVLFASPAREEETLRGELLQTKHRQFSSDRASGPLALVAEYLPLRVYLAVAHSIESGVEVWEVAFSPGRLLGEPHARPLRHTLLDAFNCHDGLRLENVEFLHSRDVLMISCTVPPEEYTVFWDPYTGKEVMPRLPVGEIFAASPDGDFLLCGDLLTDRPAGVWHLGRGKSFVLGRTAAFAGAFSSTGDTVAIIVDSEDAATDCCRLELWNTVSGRLLCTAPSPYGFVAFDRDRIAVQCLHEVVSFHVERDGTHSCWLLAEQRYDLLGNKSVSDMHLPTNRTLHVNNSVALVSRGPDVLFRLDHHTAHLHGTLSPDGRSAVLSFVDHGGEFGCWIWPFADGGVPLELHKRSHSPAFSPDGAVLATIDLRGAGANLTHLRGGGALYLSAEGHDRVHGVIVGRPKPVGL